jgi:phospho-N-acetylmuramoyl-pentapeptide-transferase
MFYLIYEWWLELSEPVKATLSPLRVFQYITVRAFCGAGTAFLLNVILGPRVIKGLKRLNFRQYVRKGEAPPLEKLHGYKEGTPTMGGLLIIGSVVLSSLLWAMPCNRYLLIALGTLCFMGMVGFLDDWLKIKSKSSKGLSARNKLLLQTGWTLFVFYLLVSSPVTRENTLKLMVPFSKDPLVGQLPYVAAFLFMAVIIVGATNAVNLTDGLDGLAVGCSGSVSLSYMIMAYISGHALFANYLLVPYVEGSGELAVFCGCLLGSCLGFLWYNCHPAQVFMGDTGSLAIGGAIAAVAILIKQELVLIIVGGVFVIEALSVIGQVISFKTRGKRIFAMAPLHHHFELKQWSETQVTVRFWIMSIICALLGILTLKIR